MPYKYCNQCKKRLPDTTLNIFCSDNCNNIYKSSPDCYCKYCNKFIGKLSVVKTKQFCNNICHNKFQHQSNLETRTCKVCKKEFTVKKSSRRHEICSIECDKIYSASKERNLRRIKTLSENNLKKYGVKFTLSLPDVISKSAKTKKEKYGNQYYSNPEKRKKTCLKKYNTTWFTNRKKAVETINEKYGGHKFNCKSNDTKLKKYGTLDFSEKSNDTKIKKYNTLNFSEKANKTKKEKYGSLKSLYLKKSYYRLKNKHSKIVEFLFSENDYVGSGGYVRYKFSCKSCNGNFEGFMTNGSSPRCPVCFPLPSISSFQTEVINYLSQILGENVSLVINSSTIIQPYELDIFIPSLKIAIEVDGIYWHSEDYGNKFRKYHLHKTEKCESMGIRLIHIFENEWYLKTDIIKNKLKHILGKDNSEKIFARNCCIKNVSNKESIEFLKNYHIQGDITSKVRIGLYYEEKLVSLMTFNKARLSLGNRTKNEDVYELTRFCSNNSRVVGGGSKLFSYFIKTHNPKKIISFADRRYSNLSSFYSQMGFRFISYTSPNYWYFHKSDTLVLHHRFGFRKDTLSKRLSNYNESLSEWENMKNNGWDRIWDCGNLKYEWTPTNSIS